MSRQIKFYPSEKRRYGIKNNLQCVYCGNTTAFYWDMRLRHQLEVEDSGLVSIRLHSKFTEKLFRSVANNIWKMIDKALLEDKPVIHCANCGDYQDVDLQERLTDYCWQVGCPGCEVCGNYIPEQEVIDLCKECIVENKGQMTEEDCQYNCPHYDGGLTAVLDHYGLSLDKLLEDMDY